MAIYKLGDLLNISSGSTPRKEKRLWKDEILWYTPIDLREKTHTIRKISKANNKKWIPKNTVLISSRAPIGYVGIAKNTCWHSQGIKGFLNNEKSIINKYLYYWVISNRRTFISNGIGTTFKEISSSIIKSIQGFFPSLKTQKQIIDIIEPVENLFLKYSNCVRIDTFENTKKDLKALIDIIEPIEKLIDLIKKIIWKVEIIKRKIYTYSIFKIEKLENIAFAKSGKQPPLNYHINNEKEGYTRFIQNRDYSNYKIKSYIPSNFKGVKVTKKDILIDKYGEPGKTRYGINGFINVAMLKLIPFENKNKESIRNHFENEEILKWLKRASQASTRPSLNWNFLKTLTIGLSSSNDLLSWLLSIELKFKKTNLILIQLKDLLVKILII